MTDSSDNREHAGLSLRLLPWVITSPSALFARVEDTGAYGPALVVLLLVAILLGCAQVQTGLIDRVVDQQTEVHLAELEKAQYGVVDKLDLKDQMDNVRKSGQFNKTMQRIAAVAITPAFLLSSFMLISAFLYAAVALTGRKPEWHTLMSICVHSGFVTIIALAVRLGMMLAYKTTQVDTTLGMLSEPGKASIGAGIDPFRIWFWILVAIGLVVTRQLSRRAAIVSCGLMFIFASAARVGFAYLGASMG